MEVLDGKERRHVEAEPRPELSAWGALAPQYFLPDGLHPPDESGISRPTVQPIQGVNVSAGDDQKVELRLRALRGGREGAHSREEVRGQAAPSRSGAGRRPSSTRLVSERNNVGIAPEKRPRPLVAGQRPAIDDGAKDAALRAGSAIEGMEVSAASGSAFCVGRTHGAEVALFVIRQRESRAGKC